MKILFVTDNFPPETNAVASRVYERALYWVRWGHEVTVVTCQPNFPIGRPYPGYKNSWLLVEEVDGIRVVRVKTYMAPNTGRLRRTLDFVSFGVSATVFGSLQPRPDVVIATSPQFFSAMSGWLLGCLKKRPFVFELGDLWPAQIEAVGMSQSRRLLRSIEKVELFLYRQSAAVVALTSGFRENLVNRGIDGKKVHVVRNGVDLQRYSPRTRDLQLAESLGVVDKKVIGYVGTHGLSQGMPAVMEAARETAELTDVAWLFVGAGAAKPQMLEVVRKWGLRNVVFVDPQPKDRVADYWSLCDIALIPLADRPLFSTVIPSKLFEAMAMGIPVLFAGPMGEASTIIREEGIGTAVPAEDPKALARAAGVMLDDEEFRMGCANSACSSVARYSREEQARLMMAVLETVVSE